MRGASGPQLADQPPERALRFFGFSGGRPARRTARRHRTREGVAAEPARRGARRAWPPPVPPPWCLAGAAAGPAPAAAAGRAAHAASSALSCEYTISRYVSLVAISSACVPIADDRAAVEDDDPVGAHDRADALGDDHDGRVADLPLEGGPQQRVRLEVERREAVVEDVDVGRA